MRSKWFKIYVDVKERVLKLNNKIKNICIGAGLLTAGIGILAAVINSVSENLIQIALDRNAPKSMKKAGSRLAGAAKLQEYLETLEEGREKLLNSRYEDVEITGSDGIRLKGHWKTCEKPKRVIIAMHGWRSSWAKDFGTIDSFWQENGCSVLYAEQRAQGESEGNYMGFGLLERYDCLEWIRWVNERTGGKLPVYLAGVSMGASTVLMAAGLDLPENVKGIISDCGFTSPYAVWKHVVEKNLHLSYRMHRSQIIRRCRKRIQMGDREYSTVEALKSSHIPVLFVHGSDDRFVPVEMTYENYKACQAPKMLLIVPGAGHGMSYYTEPEKYERAFKEFWTMSSEEQEI